MPKGNLPQLAPPELPSVTAKVVDTFIPAKQKPQNPAVQDLINSLSGFSTSLGQYQLVQEERKKVTDEAQAMADFEQIQQNKEGFKQLIKDKVIPQGASPYYINQLAKAQLKQDAREFKAKIFDEWNKSNVYRDDDPLAFDQFFQSKSKEFYEEKKLGSYNPATLAEAFLPDANATYAELNQVHRAKQIAEIERMQKELLFKETTNEIQDALKITNDKLDAELSTFPNVGSLSNYEKRFLYASQLIQKRLDDLTADGMDFDDANKTIIDSIVAYASQTENSDYLDILDNIVTDKASGSRLGSTAYAVEQKATAEDNILTKNRQNLKFQEWQEQNTRDKFTRIVNENYYDAFRDDINVLRNTEEWIKQWEIDNNYQLPAETYNQLIASRDVLIDSLTSDNVIPDAELIRDLDLEVITNPRRSFLQQDIQQGMLDGKIPYDEGTALIEKLIKNFDLSNSILFTDPTYKQLQSTFDIQLSSKGGFELETPETRLLRENTELAFLESSYIIARTIMADKELSDDQKVLQFVTQMKERQKLLLEGYLQSKVNKQTELNMSPTSENNN
jgi:hypothetical protein